MLMLKIVRPENQFFGHRKNLGRPKNLFFAHLGNKYDQKNDYLVVVKT
jgi:hypothetical protein